MAITNQVHLDIRAERGDVWYSRTFPTGEVAHLAQSMVNVNKCDVYLHNVNDRFNYVEHNVKRQGFFSALMAGLCFCQDFKEFSELLEVGK